MATKTLTMDLPAREAVQYEAAVADCIGKIDQSLVRIRRERARSQKIKAETQTIKKRFYARTGW